MESFLSELLAENADGRREMVRARLRVDVSEALLLRMEALQVSKAALATKLGVSRSAVSQALTGSRNMSLNTLADMSAALELTPAILLQPHAAARPPVVPGRGPSIDTAASALPRTFVVTPTLPANAPRPLPLYETRSSSAGLAQAPQLRAA
jgi:transcriptional regulator with XRE-family HTH domain